MKEENEKTEEKTETETPPTEETTPSEPTNLLDQSIAERKKMETLLDRKEALLEREEKLAAHNMLGGTTNAGQKPVKETEEEKWAKGAKERYDGTGMDPTEVADESGF